MIRPTTNQQYENAQIDITEMLPESGLVNIFRAWKDNLVANLCSLIFHMVALVVLARCVIRPDQSPDITFLELSLDAAISEELETSNFSRIFVERSTLTPLQDGSVSDSGGEPNESGALAPIDADHFQAVVGAGLDADQMQTLAATTSDAADGVQRFPKDLLYVLPPPRKSQDNESIGDIWSGHRDATDDIVYRFILYDIGRLPGEAGQKALADFQALGPEAIPSLVSGLNQSAYINSSCPVIIISSKLMTELSAANDPEMYRYAYNNIGKGVNPRAPYARRLASAREQIAREANRRSSNRTDKHAQASTRSAWIKKLRRHGISTIRRKLRDPDPNVRWAATRITAARGLPLYDELIELLRDSDADVRSEAHEALVRLARGGDFGPEPDADEDRVALVMDLWRDWFRQEKDRKRR